LVNVTVLTAVAVAGLPVKRGHLAAGCPPGGAAGKNRRLTV
jgi:hypothetical protein